MKIAYLTIEDITSGLFKTQILDIIEEISLLDNFTNPKNQKTSHCYRINYRSNDRNLTNEEVDEIQNKIRSLIQKDMNLEIR